MVLWIGWSLFSLCGKTKINILLMHKVLDEDTIKTWNIAPNCLWQNVFVFQKATWRKLFHAFSTSWKPGCQWQITSAFPWCRLGWSWATSPHNRSRWPLQAYMFSVSLPTRACLRHNSFCIVFSNRFNIMSAFLSTNRSLGCKKSILAKVCFDAKRG